MCLRKLRGSSQNIFSLNVIRNCREYLGSPINPRMFLSVLFNVCFEVRWLVAWKVAMCALVMFLPTLNGGVGHQVIIPTKWLVALQKTVLLYPIVSLWWRRPLKVANIFGHKSQGNCLGIFIYHLLFLLQISYYSYCLPRMTNFPFTFVAHLTTLKKDIAPYHLIKVLHTLPRNNCAALKHYQDVLLTFLYNIPWFPFFNRIEGFS